MSQQPNLHGLFERPLTLPDADARDRLGRLVGMDDKIKRLSNVLSVLINPAGLQRWLAQHHADGSPLLEAVLRRPPLVVLSGDVGSGKTELCRNYRRPSGPPRANRHHAAAFEFVIPRARASWRDDATRHGGLRHAFNEAAKFKSTKSAARGGVILLVDEAARWHSRASQIRCTTKIGQG